MIAPVQGKVGQPVTFEGYADDYGSHIVALEFSLDGGTTWARQDVSASGIPTSWSTGPMPTHLSRKESTS